MLHLNLPRRFLVALPLMFALGGCGTTVYLDKFNGGPIGQPPPPADTGTSSSTTNVSVAANPQNAGSADRFLRIARTSPTEGGGIYTATFTQNITQKKGSIDFVGFIPSQSRIMMTVFFESSPQGIPLMHIDLLPNGNIRLNDSSIIGTYKFDTIVGFFITLDLSTSSPTANILIRGGANDASLTTPLPPNSNTRGFGRVRIIAPFEGVNAPNGAFLVNDIIATTPN